MKKFVVIVISLVIISVFLALNYTLWDRESLINQKEANKTTIETLSRELNNLKKLNQDMNSNLSKLNKQINKLKSENISLSNEIKDLKQRLEYGYQLAALFKKQINLHQFQVLIEKWTGYINQKDYTSSYMLLADESAIFGQTATFRDYVKSFDAFKEIRLLSFEESLDMPDTQSKKEGSLKREAPLSHTILVLHEDSSSPDATVFAAVRVSISLKEGIKHYKVKEGENFLKFKFTYNFEENQWFIKSVNVYKYSGSKDVSKTAAYLPLG